MKMKLKSRYLIAATAIVVISTALYAAFIINETTISQQPTTTLAPYALSGTDLSGDSVHAYAPWLENGAWQGDLIQYTLCGQTPTDTTTCPAGSAGKLITDAVVGSNPPEATGTNWMARATFYKNECADTNCTSYTDYWDTKRNIYTYDADKPGQVNFRWKATNGLSATQMQALDPAAYDPNGDGVFTDTLSASPILNFIRGDHSNEKSNTGGTYRIRFSLLGDIINSNPVYIGDPPENFNFDNFSTFKTDNTGREKRIAIGANDGMLHVFDAANGDEVYAYIPSMLIVDPDYDPGSTTPAPPPPVSKLDKLKNIPYVHTYFVDGELTAADAEVGTTSGNWKTVLTGGLGAGAKGLFALDVTNPDASNDKVLFEKTGADIGHIYGSPTIARLANGKWYIVTGNGFGSTSGKASLLLISLEDYTVTKISACEGTSCAPVAEGLAAPTLVDTDGDSVVDFAYAGDDSGNIWRFNLHDNTVIKLYTGKIDTDGTPLQPITTAPEIGSQPNGGYMVYFGTGTIQHQWEGSTNYPANTYPPQAIYGIWDRGPGTKIVDQTLHATEPTFTNSSPCTITTPPAADIIRYMDTANSVDYLCTGQDPTQCTKAKGWRVSLPADEQVLGSPKLRAGRVTVVTRGPGTDGAGSSWLMSLDYLTGGDGGEVVFNTNHDQSLDACDEYTGGKFPVGVGLGDGNISQPDIARLGQGQDIMLINGLRLPVQPAPILLDGHLDVETDSPYGGTMAPSVSPAAPHYSLTQSDEDETEGYDMLAAVDHDGAGGAVDGHFHEYSDANNLFNPVTNTIDVDLFRLEPRRGKASFIGAPVVPTTNATDTTPPVCPGGSVVAGDGCIGAVVPELNRAYDTTLTTPESEVYGNSGQTTRLANNKEFIIVVANGDLSPSAELQIGCDSWPVVEYEDAITNKLETSGDPVSALRSFTLDGHTGFVFTLDDIAKAGGSNGKCGDGSTPSVRVKLNQRSILDGGVVGTRSQCVLGLHDYRDPVCYSDQQVLSNADFSNVTDTTTYDSYSSPNCSNNTPAPPPPVGYVRRPARNLHITESMEGKGNKYRWRNGALTVQFIDVLNFKQGTYCQAAHYDNTECPLQDPNTLPVSNGGGTRFGGTYARAFRLSTKKSSKNPVILTYTDNTTLMTKKYNGGVDNGLLYELTMFWHFSDLADNLRRAPPASIPCYGDSSYNSALKQELGGLTYGEYKCLTTGVGGQDCGNGIGDPSNQDSLYSQYVRALDKVQGATSEGELNQALLDLANLLKDNPDLAKYDHYRRYAPGHVPEQHLLPIDKDLLGTRGSPAARIQSRSSERVHLGPNLTAGRRSWIDLSD